MLEVASQITLYSNSFLTVSVPFVVPAALLLFANREYLHTISMDTPDRTDVLLPIIDIQDAVAVDFDYENKKFYFTDVKVDVIRLVPFRPCAV